MSMSQAESQQLLKTHLNFSMEELQPVYAAQSLEAGQQLLDEIRARIKKSYKRAALELHPDRTGGDAAKSEIFTKLSALMTQIENWKVARPQPRPMVHVFVTHFYSGTTTTGTGTTTSGGWYTPSPIPPK